MIDCNVHVEKKPDPKGDRVLLTFEYVPPAFSLRHAVSSRSPFFLTTQRQVPQVRTMVRFYRTYTMKRPVRRRTPQYYVSYALYIIQYFPLYQHGHITETRMYQVT